jgi:REP element-mobilizing transposase RayT
MRPRQILPGATYLVTRRCTQRQFLLTPTTRRHVEAFVFCLAYAVKRTGVQIHAVVVMGNHYHIVLTDPLGVLPVFAECLNKLVAKCMNAMRGRWENFWSSEPVSYVRLLDDEAIVDKIAYTLCNPVQEGLVKRGEQWPGLRLGRPGRYRVRRPKIFFREEGSMPASIALELTTPPLDELSGREAQRHIDEAVAAREIAERDRVLAAGRVFLGRRAVIQQDPFASPTTREPRRELSPRVASRNKWLRIETLARCAEFARHYREALTAWCEKKRNAVFPPGTYLMRIRHLVDCAEA